MSAREWDAQSYHRLSNAQYGWGVRVLERLALRGDETVIDAGCGTGRVTAELAGRIPRGRVLAVDLSRNMLRGAGEYLASLPPARRAPLALVCADLAALPFHAIADGVFSTAAFHWVRDHDALFRSIFVALKPGGWLVAQCGGGPNLLRLRERAQRLMESAEFASYFAGWTPPQFYADEHETAARLRRAGFSSVATWISPAGFALPCAQDYREYLRTVTLHQHVDRIADLKLQGRFLDLLTEQALADPELHLDYWRLNIHARKE